MSHLTCRELIEFLDDFVEGVLPRERHEVFEAHLRICSDCRNYLDEYRRSVGLVRSLRERDPDGSPPSNVPSGLVKGVLRALGKQ